MKILGKLDHMILNHASMEHEIGIDFTFTEEQIDLNERSTRITFLSFVNIIQFAMPHLQKSGGSIGVTSSIAGKLQADLL